MNNIVKFIQDIHSLFAIDLLAYNYKESCFGGYICTGCIKGTPLAI